MRTRRSGTRRSGNSKKTAGIVAAATLLIAALGGAGAYAAGGVHTVQKNVVMTENTAALNAGVQDAATASSDQATTGAANGQATAGVAGSQTTIAAPIQQDQAYNIAGQALKQMFGASVEGMDKQAYYYDEQKVKADQEYQAKTYPDKKMAWIPEFKEPYWTVTYTVPVDYTKVAPSKIVEATNKQRNSLLQVTVDAESGAIRYIVDYSKSAAATPSSAEKSISAENAVQNATAFETSNDLNRGAAIQNTTTYSNNGDFTVVFRLDNGQSDYVGINGHTGDIVLYTGNADQGELDYLKQNSQANG